MMSKNILIVSTSPRKNGNSEIVEDTFSGHLKGCRVTVFKMQEHDCRPCRACAPCQNKDTRRMTSPHYCR